MQCRALWAENATDIRKRNYLTSLMHDCQIVRPCGGYSCEREIKTTENSAVVEAFQCQRKKDIGQSMLKNIVSMLYVIEVMTEGAIWRNRRLLFRKKIPCLDVDHLLKNRLPQWAAKHKTYIRYLCLNPAKLFMSGVPKVEKCFFADCGRKISYCMVFRYLNVGLYLTRW